MSHTSFRLCRDWNSGQRVYCNEIISDGVYDIVSTIIDDLHLQNPQLAAGVSYGSLMARLQREYNASNIRLSFRPPPSTLRPAGAGTSRDSPPRSNRKAGAMPGAPAGKRTRNAPPPPPPPPSPPPSVAASSSASPSASASTASASAATAASASASASSAGRRVGRREMAAVDRNNEFPAANGRRYTLRNRHRTDLYSEPLFADWGLRGTETAAVPGRLPVRQQLQDRMSHCSRCHGELTEEVDHSRFTPAQCVTCGNYLRRKVCIFWYFCLFTFSENYVESLRGFYPRS